MGFKGCLASAHNTLEFWIVVERLDQILDHLVLLRESAHINVLSLLVYHLAVVNSQRDVCHLFQLIGILGDEHTVMQRLIGFQLRMAMSADNEVNPRELFCHLDIILVAQVTQQDGDVPLATQFFVLTQYILCRLEDIMFQIVRMGIRRSART